MITRVSVHTHCNELGGKVWNPAITWTKKYAVFITIENEHGTTGLGECWCFDTAPDALVAYLRTEILPHVLGATVTGCAEIHQHLVTKATLTARHGLLASAWSGIDIALWDMRSREAGLPLWKFLAENTPCDSKSNGQVHLYASGGLYGENKTIDDLVTELNSMHSSGFDIVKMKIGGLSVEDDLARVNAVLRNLNSTCRLIIDGVYSYSVAQALQIYSVLPTDRIEAFQSPLKADDLTGMKALCEAGVPVMATEAEYRHEIHQHLIHDSAVRYLQTAPIACGGISRLLQLSEQVAQSDNEELKLSLEVSSTAIALLAAAHYAAGCKNTAHVEYHYLHQVFFDALDLPRVENRTGWFRLPETSGLGIELPESDTQLEYTQT